MLFSCYKSIYSLAKPRYYFVILKCEPPEFQQPENCYDFLVGGYTHTTNMSKLSHEAVLKVLRLWFAS